MEILPLELLTDKLNSYKKALSKSEDAFKNGKISLWTHNIHKVNLNRLIAIYEISIRKLTIN